MSAHIRKMGDLGEVIRKLAQEELEMRVKSARVDRRVLVTEYKIIGPTTSPRLGETIVDRKRIWS